MDEIIEKGIKPFKYKIGDEVRYLSLTGWDILGRVVEKSRKYERNVYTVESGGIKRGDFYEDQLLDPISPAQKKAEEEFRKVFMRLIAMMSQL